MAWLSILKTTQSNKFAISLQYLKEKLGMEFLQVGIIMSKKSKILLLWSKMFRYCMGAQSCFLLFVIFYLYSRQSCNFNYSNLLLFINNCVSISHCNNQTCSYSYWCKNVLVCPGEKSSFEKLRLLLFSKLSWNSYILCIAKIAALICSKKLPPSKVVLYLCNSVTLSCMEYCYHVSWPQMPPGYVG